MKIKTRSIVATITLSALLFTEIAPVAFAQIGGGGTAQSVPTYGTINDPKESGIFGIISWDSLAWVAKNVIVQMVLDDLQQWAASGFQGSPHFLENPDQFFMDVGNQATGAFIGELGQQLYNDPGFFCNFAPQLIYDVSRSGRRGNYRARCTVTDVVNNVESHFDRFQNGGWAAFARLQENYNNPLDSYLVDLYNLQQAREEAENTFILSAQAGGGYIPQAKCSQRAGAQTGAAEGIEGQLLKAIGCKRWTIQTPAKTVGDRVASYVGSDLQKIVPADELSETIQSAIVGVITLALRNLSKK